MQYFFFYPALKASKREPVTANHNLAQSIDITMPDMLSTLLGEINTIKAGRSVKNLAPHKEALVELFKETAAFTRYV